MLTTDEMIPYIYSAVVYSGGEGVEGIEKAKEYLREVLRKIENQAHAAGRTAGLQEAMGITLAVGDSVRNEYNATTELAERHAVTRCVNSIKGAIEALK